VFVTDLAANHRLRSEITAFARSGRPVLAECGGLLYLASELDGRPMCGVLPVRATMTRRLTLGYREATAITATPWLAAGEQVRGHEFHYAQAEDLHGERARAWRLAARGSEREEGYVSGTLQASFLHVHWAAFPRIARRLAAAARLEPSPVP
jgi:cobyrinic acid a,c-diamide synthase